MGNFYPSNIFGNYNIKALIIWLLSKGIEWISTNKYYIHYNFIEYYIEYHQINIKFFKHMQLLFCNNCIFKLDG